MKFRIIIYFAIALFLMSCSNNEDNIGINKIPKLVTFQSSQVEGQEVELRAQGNSWDYQDSIGVFMKKAGETLSLSTVISGAENKKYITHGDGAFLSSSDIDRIYYPSDNSDIDFIAYYPYQPEIKGYILPIDISDQKSQESIDLLYSDNIKDININSSKSTTLYFNHQLVKIRLNISLQDESQALDELQISILGMETKASFALDSGTLSIDESSEKDIPIKVISTPSGIIAEAIVFPQEAIEGRVFKMSSLTIGSYKWNIPASEQYEKGKKYTYNITLN